MRVALRIFSGRPDPTWRLTPEETNALKSALGKLERVPYFVSAPEGLGYCGMTVFNEDQNDRWTEIIVYHEAVTVCYRGRSSCLVDEERALENLLLSTAGHHVSARVRQSIRAEPCVTS